MEKKMDPRQFDRIVREVFAPVYPMIAEQIVERTGTNRGTCLDIGCGGGYLGAALAGITNLSVRFFDKSPEMLAIAERTIEEGGLQERAKVLQSDVTNIPLPDGSVDLAVSRGSIFFWEDLSRAFSEIRGVLAPGGVAYVGGGFGSRELRQAIEREMKSRNGGVDKFGARVRKNLSVENRQKFAIALENAGIDSYEILHEEEIGLWVLMRK